MTITAGLMRIKFQLHSQEVVGFLYIRCTASLPMKKQLSETAAMHNREQQQAQGDPLIPFLPALVQDDLLPAPNGTEEVVHFQIGQ